TEIRTRIAIDPKRGTVKQGQLWNEENLPAETLLWGIYALNDSMNRADDDSRNADLLSGILPDSDTLLQLGGKAGVGRGLVRFLTPRA
ncbi:MAG TPA: type III-B CRISPR module RAMP protein Cmr4, partial [Chromatiaceae bacterium]|nr:type III-B CRISPR module RAMP protein Cmr4 [Chromatiaceae bacterium]